MINDLRFVRRVADFADGHGSGVREARVLQMLDDAGVWLDVPLADEVRKPIVLDPSVALDHNNTPVPE